MSAFHLYEVNTAEGIHGILTSSEFDDIMGWTLASPSQVAALTTILVGLANGHYLVPTEIKIHIWVIGNLIMSDVKMLKYTEICKA